MKPYVVTPHLNSVPKTVQMKPYVVTLPLNHLDETVQMRDHIIWFQLEMSKFIPKLPSNIPFYLEVTRVLHAGANAQLQQLSENSKTGHN